MNLDFLKFKVGDKLNLNGKIFTARDKAHVWLLQDSTKFSGLNEGIIYHCGPIVRKVERTDKKLENKWETIAAGPTTSARMNPFTPDIIKKYNIKAIVGKGGMDERVQRMLKGQGVYLSVIGGAALVYAKAIKIKSVYKLEEFGMADAIWEMDVKDFPVIVTIDSKGNSIYDEILEYSKNVRKKILDS